MSRVRLMGTEADYRKMVEDGRAQLHNFGEGFAITQIVNYANPQETVLNVLLLGGKGFNGWRGRADTALVRFARANGCSAIEFSCRIGLAEKVKELGYRTEYAVMRKELQWEQQQAGQSR